MQDDAKEGWMAPGQPEGPPESDGPLPARDHDGFDLADSAFDAPGAAEAARRLTECAAGLGRQVSEALRCLEQGFAAAQIFCLSQGTLVRIRATKALERPYARD